MEHIELMADRREMNDKVVEGYQRECAKGRGRRFKHMQNLAEVAEWRIPHQGWTGELMI